jgi:hypothetical protein
MMAEVSRCITLHNVLKVGGEMATVGFEADPKIKLMLS